MKLAGALMGSLVLSLGCSSSSSDGASGVEDAASDTTTFADVASDATPDVAALDSEDSAATYPAFHPAVPEVTSVGGPVIAAPVIVPVVFPATAFKAEIDDFLAKGVASAEWTAQLTEYGVGAGSVVPSVVSEKLPSATIAQGDLETFVHDQIEAGAWGEMDPAEYGSRFYVLFLPNTVSISLPSGKSTCGDGPYGYHREVLVGSTHVPYAVVANCGKGLDPVTKIAWHEMIEGCADPYVASNRAFVRTTPSWGVAFGGEIGDMCEYRADQKITPDDIGYAIQRTWSNASAKAYHDPCVPAGKAPYFAAAPVLPDMVSLGMATTPGVTIAVGASVTIDVRLFSDGPTSGPFAVSARESKGGSTLSFAWDKTSGINGDTLHLTITAVDAAPSGTTFEIKSDLDGASSLWVGAVAN